MNIIFYNINIENNNNIKNNSSKIVMLYNIVNSTF